MHARCEEASGEHLDTKKAVVKTRQDMHRKYDNHVVKLGHGVDED
jgi:hypothetical protein